MITTNEIALELFKREDAKQRARRHKLARMTTEELLELLPEGVKKE